MKKVKLLSDYRDDWDYNHNRQYVTMRGLNGKPEYYEIHLGNLGAYIWWNRSTYYLYLY